jgi:hypothetical protein
MENVLVVAGPCRGRQDARQSREDCDPCCPPEAPAQSFPLSRLEVSVSTDLSGASRV